jgi:hypothetical protein
MDEQVKGVGELFDEAWTAYKQRGLTILGVMIVSTLVITCCMLGLGVAATLLLGGLDQVIADFQQGMPGPVTMVSTGLLVALFVLLALWSQCTVLAAAMDDSLGIISALGVGWQRLWGFGWVVFLVSAIVTAGFILFFIPGIFFSVSLLFAIYFYLEDDLRGMDAVLASHYAVKGRWWNTLGKLFLIWLMAVALELIPVVGQILYFIFMPFLLFFLVAMYRNLRDTATEPAVSGSRTGWSLLAAIGIVIPLLGLVGAVVTLGPQLPVLIEQWRQVTRNTVPGTPPPVSRVPKTDNQNQPPPTVEPRGVVQERVLVWNDPVGDVEEFGVGRWLDIEKVRVEPADNALNVNLHLHFPLTAAYNAASTTARSLHRVGVFYLDTDLKRSTGTLAGRELVRGGYDLGIDITLEAPRNRPLEGNIHVGLFRIHNGTRTYIGAVSEELVQVGSKDIRLQLPYALLGIHKGEQVRMSFVESAQKQGSGLVKDKIITL